MAKEFRASRDFDLSPEELLSVLTDERFLLAKAAKFGGDGRPSAARTEAGGVTVRMPRRLPVEHVPGPFRSFAGNGRLVQVEEWQVSGAPITGSLHTEAGNTPVTLTGTMTISETADGCNHAIVGEVRVDVFAVGGAAERAARGPLHELLQNELEFTGSWIREHRRPDA